MQMRARALERRRLPDELDRMLTVASPPAWLGVLALAMAIAGLVVWGFLGTLPREVSAQGLLSTGAPTSVQSTVSGQVASVAIEPDPHPRSGLKWSTHDGPPFPLRPGVSLSAQIVETSQHPADVLFGT